MMLKLVHVDELPEELNGQACSACPKEKVKTGKHCSFACVVEAKKRGIADPISYHFFDKLTFITWRLKK